MQLKKPIKASYTTKAKTLKLPIPGLRFSWLHIVVIALAFMWFRSCENADFKQSEIDNFNAFISDTISYYTNKNGQEVATRNALQGAKNSLEMMLAASQDSTQQLKSLVSHYKRVSAAVTTQSTTVIEDIEIPYTIEGSSFSIPFSVSKEFYSLSGKSTNTGLFLDNITIPNRQSIVIGSRKSGFFKTEYKIEVVNSNPFIKTTQVEGYSFSQAKKRLGLGVFVGYGLSSAGFTPQIGVGLTYNLIQF